MCHVITHPCLNCNVIVSSMRKKAHRRSDRVFFHDIGITGVDDMNSVRWKSLTLGGIMEYLGHRNVSKEGALP